MAIEFYSLPRRFNMNIGLESSRAGVGTRTEAISCLSSSLGAGAKSIFYFSSSTSMTGIGMLFVVKSALFYSPSSQILSYTFYF
jgi:hypothetical protein